MATAPSFLFSLLLLNLLPRPLLRGAYCSIGREVNLPTLLLRGDAWLLPLFPFESIFLPYIILQIIKK